MRTFRRLLAAVSALALGALLLASPATAGREVRPAARTATRSIVHAGPAGPSQQRPTSFGVFSRGGLAAKDAPATTPRSALTPVHAFGFDALSDLDGAVPSDTTGALGDDFFVTATNVRTAVYALDGTEVIAPTPLDTLHPDSLGGFAFDPKVVYDQFHDTFVLVYLVQDDSPQTSLIVTVAIPNATADDPNTWCSTSYAGDPVGTAPALWADYPAVGFNQDRVTISTNQFTFPSSQGQFAYAQVMTLDSAQLYDCNLAAPTATVFAGAQTRDANGFQAFTLQPAQTVGGSASQLLVSVQLAGRNSYLIPWRIKATASGFALKKGTVPIGTTKFPPPGTQGGGSLSNPDTFWDAGDDRLINAFYDAARNELFTAHAVLKDFDKGDGYPESAVRWYELNPANKLNSTVLARKGLVGTALTDAGWPSVATDGQGNLFITYSRASQPLDEFLSAWVASVSPNSTTAQPVLLVEGLATYDAINGLERWGDYTAINRGPVDPDFVAIFNQYALNGSSWQQTVDVVANA